MEESAPALFGKSPAWLALIVPAYALVVASAYLWGYWLTFQQSRPQQWEPEVEPTVPSNALAQ